MHKRPGPTYNVALMRHDMVALGLNVVALARATRPRLSHMTVSRFLSEERQTPKSAKRIARALGHDVERYLIRAEAVAS